VCRSPERAEIADERSRKKPDEKVCTGCHNERSPHFKGFFYGAMARYSHYVRK
jgi:hypothetical protein